MTVQELKVKQFAGLLDRSVELTPGMNIIVGPNETGKTTLADFLHAMFFQSTKSSDKEFIDRSFTKRTDGTLGDHIRGTVRFEKQTGEYTLSKTWRPNSGKNKKGNSVLHDDVDGDIEDEDLIELSLASMLKYGEGLYNEFIFPSQRRDALKKAELWKKLTDGLQSDSKKGKDPLVLLTEVVTQMVMGADLSADDIEAALAKKVQLYMENWNQERGEPETDSKKQYRGISNKWESATTKAALNGQQAVILKSFYDVETLRLAKVSVEKVLKAENEKSELESKRDLYNKNSSIIKNHNLNAQQRETQAKHLEKMKKALEEWPQMEEQLKTVKRLVTSLAQAKILEAYQQASDLSDKYEEVRAALEKLGGPFEKEDVQESEKLSDRITELCGKLSGMNIKLRFCTYGDHSLTVTSSVTGQQLSVSEELPISDAVTISIPEVADIELMPADIELEQVQMEIKESKEKRAEIYEKYHLQPADDLQSRCNEYDRLSLEMQSYQNKLDLVLGGKTIEELARETEKVPADLQARQSIQEELDRFCEKYLEETQEKEKNPEQIIGELKGALKSFQIYYTDPLNLKKNIEISDQAIRDLQGQEDQYDLLPDEFKTPEAENAENYMKILNEKIKNCEESIEEEKKVIKEKLGIKLAFEEITAEFEAHKAAFEEKKAEGKHWLEIQETFHNVRKRMEENPAEELGATFAEYLTELSGGSLELKNLDSRMKASISSNKRELSSKILSNGTKETIALAFRIAVLESLFPEGGCVAVFDDPFTDMDPERTKKACLLLQQFAEKNQVLFLTCDKKYEELLTGNVIPF